MFTKKARAKKCFIFEVLSRRDLSYETDSGSKTKTDYLSRKAVQFLKRFLINLDVSQLNFCTKGFFHMNRKSVQILKRVLTK